MNGFWALAAGAWPPSAPTHHLVRALGADSVQALVAVGVLQQHAIRPWGTVPCSECRRDARVVYEADGAVACCTGDFQCPDEPLGPAPSRTAMDVADFARRLAGALQLEGVPGRDGPVVALGRRKLGDEDVAFDLCPRPGHADVMDALAKLARGGPAVRVVLVPDVRRLPADAPCEVAGMDVVWAGLHEVLALKAGLAVDLRPILARRAFRGAGLVIDDRGASWQGRTVLPAEDTNALRLLRTLAGRPGEFRGARELWVAVWPENHTRNGLLPKGANPDVFDGRLRRAVGDLRAALEAAGAVSGVVENERGTGRYRLALAATRIQLS